MTAKQNLIFTEDALTPHLTPDKSFTLRDGKDLENIVARISGSEAHRLCNKRMISGRMSYERDKETRVKTLKVKFLILTSSQAELRVAIERLQFNARRTIAEDCNTTKYWIDGYSHNGKNKYYAGGPARLGVVVNG